MHDGGKKILIVEDDPEMIELGELFLGKAGYQVLSALGGEAGLDVLHREPVDLVLLDIMMAGVDGWQVLRLMRAHERWQKIPVIVVSARHHSTRDSGQGGPESLFTDYVVKPFVVRDLLEKIEMALAA
jgi:DNA-binding response OmpR family regulator